MNTLQQLQTAGRVTDKTTLGRTILVTYGEQWHTLRSIEKYIRQRFGHADTQPTISARLRDVKKRYSRELTLQKRSERINNKNVWFYRIVSVTQPTHTAPTKEAA
ncbi:hypothetical protein [Veronia pacifica]|uniref:Uncharacterized protein n=1 Tax=Veronia pacifica TaxID=1080227 RepID=A0A1C3E9I0_9GAMM|nr:hypothetical protein [Veronia pacifica]ODA29876.1 hypothetical protein A8L45_21490 [Veronia pacifica]